MASHAIYTDAVNGMPAMWLKASLRAAGIDLERLPRPTKRGTEHLPIGAEPWKNVWSAGQGVGLIQALDTAAFAALDAHLGALERDSDTLGCVILTGAEASFCAGADLSGVAEGVAALPPRYKPRIVDRLAQLPLPDSRPFAAAEPESVSDPRRAREQVARPDLPVLSCRRPVAENTAGSNTQRRSRWLPSDNELTDGVHHLSIMRNQRMRYTSSLDELSIHTYANVTSTSEWQGERQT